MVSPARRSVLFVGSMVFAAAALSGCGSDEASGTSKRLGDGGPCDLITPSELKDIVGMGYKSGEAEGPQCFFSAEETLGSPMVTVGSGISVTGNAGSAEVTDTDVSGVAAKQMKSQPGGDSCTVEIALVPDDTSQTFNADVSGMTDGDACKLASQLASRILEGLPG